jgi:hypothetical protein
MRFGMRWVGWYTRDLPDDVAARRRAEIACDLWEHQYDAARHGVSAFVFSLEVVGRVLSGVPADLSWRRAVGRQPRARLVPGGNVVSRVASKLEMAFVILVTLNVAMAFSMVPLIGTEVLYGIRALGVVAVLVTALVVRARAPRTSFALTVLGTIGAVALWFWLPPVYLIGLVTIIVGALATIAQRPRTKAPAT